MITLYTIGSSGWAAEAFFTTLQAAGVKRVLDIRHGGNTLLSGFSIKRDLPYLLRAIGGIDYQELAQLAPTQASFRAVRKGEITTEAYLAAYGESLAETDVLDCLDAAMLDRGCLLCSEHEPTGCHRRVAAEAIRARWPEVAVRHLTRQSMSPSSHYA